MLNYHTNLVESRHFDFASDLPDFRGVAFPRVVRFLVDTSKHDITRSRDPSAQSLFAVLERYNPVHSKNPPRVSSLMHACATS